MIEEININNVSKLNKSFINYTFIKNELDNNPFARLFILKENSKVIGYIYYSDIYERAEINQFEIEKSNRNCGKGYFLLKETLKIVDKDISLEVKVNNISAINLYKKCGFIEIATRKGYYEGKDGILMLKKKGS